LYADLVGRPSDFVGIATSVKQLLPAPMLLSVQAA
jgi:hypothetical protein